MTLFPREPEIDLTMIDHDFSDLTSGEDLFEGLSTGTKVGEVTREGKDASEIKEAVESIF